MGTYPQLSAPIHSHLHLSTPICTYPHLSAPMGTYPHQSTPMGTYPYLWATIYNYEHLSAPIDTYGNLFTSWAPIYTNGHLSAPIHTYGHLSTHTLSYGRLSTHMTPLLAIGSAKERNHTVFRRSAPCQAPSSSRHGSRHAQCTGPLGHPVNSAYPASASVCSGMSLDPGCCWTVSPSRAAETSADMVD